jgi:hypothetical protein
VEDNFLNNKVIGTAIHGWSLSKHGKIEIHQPDVSQSLRGGYSKLLLRAPTEAGHAGALSI